ncbi:MAG: GTPase ObgE [Erysipelotrichaceae bacterium]|nr:GTPase ObgE [Erysipelotrichaceae bacterium]
MFIDQAKVRVRGGKGGDGAISMYREKFIEFGGPDGGRGGRGGSIIFKATSNLSTLFPFRYNRLILAENGQNGGSKNKYGASGADTIVEVPIGTVVYDEQTDQFLCDLSNEGDEYVVAKGGKGGRGNASFKSSKNRVPRIAENGDLGEERSLVLELKLLADIGLIGLPNAGKSTLLSLITAANPKIAPYPFTTITPNLGVVNLANYATFVVADLPGLIEGATEGKGLGFQFLRHVERCRVLVHLVAMDGESDPYEAYQTIRKEIINYGYNIEARPEIIVASKMDEPGADELLKKFEQQLNIDVDIYPISALTDEGLKELLDEMYRTLQETPPFPLYAPSGEDLATYRVYDAATIEEVPFNIIRLDAHTYEIVGDEVVNTYRRYNLSTDEGMLRLLQYLRKIGVDDKLDELGLEDGDTVLLDDFEFEYFK